MKKFIKRVLLTVLVIILLLSISPKMAIRMRLFAWGYSDAAIHAKITYDKDDSEGYFNPVYDIQHKYWYTTDDGSGGYGEFGIFRLLIFNIVYVHVDYV